jgi:hypothetical protein
MRIDDPENYCERLALKICYYLKHVHNYSVLRMDLDFFQDESGRIWLFYMSNAAVKNDNYLKVDKILAGVKLHGLNII